MQSEAEDQGLTRLLQQQKQNTQRLLLRDRGQTHVIPVEQIDYVEAQDDYIMIHAGQQSWMKTQTLSELEAQLNAAEFIRIHRSYLLRLGALKALEKSGKDSQLAVLQNGTKIPDSRAGMERLKTLQQIQQ